MADNSFAVFKTILAYSIFIILAPIFTFFVTKSILFEGLFGLSGVATNVWSAVAAVIILHIGLGAYIYKAYDDANKGKDGKVD